MLTKIRITEVGEDDAYFGTQKKIVGREYEVDLANAFTWDTGFTGFSAVTEGQEIHCFHSVKFEVLP